MPAAPPPPRLTPPLAQGEKAQLYTSHKTHGCLSGQNNSLNYHSTVSFQQRCRGKSTKMECDYLNGWIKKLSILGCVLPLQEVALHQSLPSFSVLCYPRPYRSLSSPFPFRIGYVLDYVCHSGSLPNGGVTYAKNSPKMVNPRDIAERHRRRRRGERENC